MDNQLFPEEIRPIMKKVSAAILFVILMISCAVSLADIPLEAPYFTDAVFAEKVRIKPKDATDKTVTWSSSNAAVATVDANGKVKALKKGTCKITCTANDGSGKKATCKITVK